MSAEKSEQKPFDFKGLLQSIIVKRWKSTVVIKYEMEEGEVSPQGKFRSQVVLYNKEEEVRRFLFGTACSHKKDSQQSAAKLAMQELDGIDSPTNGTGMSNARSSLTIEPSRDNHDAHSLSPISPTISSRQHIVDATVDRNAHQYEYSNVFNPRVANVAAGTGPSTTPPSPNGATKATSNHSEEEEQGNSPSVGLGTISAEYTDRMKQNKDWKGELQMLMVRAYKTDVEIKYGHCMKYNLSPGADDDNKIEHLSICILRHIDQDNVGTCIVMGEPPLPMNTEH